MTPDPTPSPSPTSPSDGDSRTASSAGSDFFADPGPAFDTDAPPPPPQVDDTPPLAIVWDAAVVESCLTAKGQLLHTAIGKAEADWIYTRDELRAIAPPLTRILNRYDATRAAAATGDEIALVLGLTGYVGRSVQERRAVMAAERAAEEALSEPVYEAPGDPVADFSDAELPDTPPITRR